MIAIRTILFPTDGSEHSRAALGYALAFAAQHGARLVALHVIDRRWEEQTRHVSGQLGEDVLQRIRQGHEEAAHEFLQEAAAAAERAGVAVETRIVHGFPAGEIVRMSAELPADLIIMGTHGRTGIAHAVLGSVAERVLRRALCPVLTIRQEAGAGAS